MISKKLLYNRKKVRKTLNTELAENTEDAEGFV